jgi:ABC-type transporter Mla subunit MlaD
MGANVLHSPAESMHGRTIPGGSILTSIKTLTDAASEIGKNAKESMEELGRSAGRKLDDARDQTAGALHSAASSVRSTGRQSSAAIDNLSTGAADRLDDTASYIDNHELSDVVNGLRKFGRRHLTESLVFAAAIGFLAGAALNRATHTCRRTSDVA